MKKLLLLVFLLFALPSSVSACPLEDDVIHCVPVRRIMPIHEPVVDASIADRVTEAREILRQCSPETDVLVSQLKSIGRVPGNISMGGYGTVDLSDSILASDDNSLAWLLSHEVSHAELNFDEDQAYAYEYAVIAQCAYLAPPGLADYFLSRETRVDKTKFTWGEIFATANPP